MIEFSGTMEDGTFRVIFNVPPHQIEEMTEYLKEHNPDYKGLKLKEEFLPSIVKEDILGEVDVLLNDWKDRVEQMDLSLYTKGEQ